MKNVTAKIIAAVFTAFLLLIGSSSISAFLNAVANPGRSHGRPGEILIGGMLFSIAMICVIGLCNSFSKKGKF